MKRNVEKGNGKNLKDKSLVGMVWRCRKDLAITVFRPKLQELWDAIASGINSL